MKILTLGDVCGEAGVELARRRLGALRRSSGADLIIINGENATGRGITPDIAHDLLLAGADVITLGNHAFDNRRILPMLEEDSRVVRPYNRSSRIEGRGYCVTDVCGARVCVVSLLGRLYMDINCDSPFDAFDALLREVQADLYVVDFHAQATSEKKAMGYHVDGRAAVMFGTHTHVQTADARILPRGTGYITDVGMTGAAESVIGVRWQQSLEYFRGGLTQRFENSDLDCRIQGALFELDQRGACLRATLIDTE